MLGVTTLLGVLAIRWLAENYGKSEPEVVHIGIPFGWSKELDPRHPLTVGDTLLSDHTVMRWAHRRVGLPWEPLLGRIKIDPTEGTLAISLAEPIKRSDGTVALPKEALEQLSKAIEAAAHDKWQSKVLKKEVVSGIPGESILHLRFQDFPFGIEARLSFGELGILNPGYPQISTGPYFVERIMPELAILRRNHHFPPRLRANAVENVHIHSLPGETLVARLMENPRSLNFATLPGFFVSKPTVNKIARCGFAVNRQTNNWVMYAVIDADVPYSVRKKIQRILLQAQTNVDDETSEIGDIATSLTPPGFGGSLNVAEFRAAILETRTDRFDQGYSATIAIREQVNKAGLFLQWAEGLRRSLPHSIVRQYPLSQTKEFLRGKHSVRMSAIGTSSFDPIAHWQVLWANMPASNQAVSRSVIDKLVRSRRPDEIRANARAVERFMLLEGLYIPMVFAPSLNFVSNDFEGNRKLEDDWGLQTWAYRWRGGR